MNPLDELKSSGELTPEIRELLRQKSRGSLYFFAKGVLGYDWLVPHIHGPVAELLQDQTKKRKKIVLPRGWLKTTIATIAYPIWRSVRDPNVRILLAQNTFKNASQKLLAIRGQWEGNPVLRSLFPELIPSKNEKWSTEALCLKRSKHFPESTYECAGIRTQVTSRHYNVIIEDDTVAPDLDELGEESLAPTYDDIAQAIGWHRLVNPLLTNPQDDEILVIGTRWYDEDLMAWIEEKEPYYCSYTRACREDEHGDPDPDGKITYPERFGEQQLTELEAAMGRYMFSCLYLNTPIRKQDMIFQPEWFRYYETPPRDLVTFTSIDPATDPELSRKGEVDYNVVLTCGKDLSNGRIYVLDYFRSKTSPGEMIYALFNHVRMYHPMIVGYEDVAYQRSLDYWIKEQMKTDSLFFRLEPIPTRKKAKETRIRGLQPVFQSGSIYLKTWMQDLISELTKFPLGRNDDLADALSMQLHLWPITKSRREEEAMDPTLGTMTLEGALGEIHGRHRQNQNSPVFSVLDTTKEFDHGQGTGALFF